LKSGGEDNQLTQVQAQYRAELVSNVEYEVSLSLPKGPMYFGKTIVKFNLSRVPKAGEPPLFIDYFGADVSNLSINGKDVGKETNYYRNGMIVLDQTDKLIVGQNMITIQILNNYRNDGYGLHSFVDQVDMQ